MVFKFLGFFVREKIKKRLLAFMKTHIIYKICTKSCIRISVWLPLSVIGRLSTVIISHWTGEKSANNFQDHSRVSEQVIQAAF
jgi:hypothetical protein